MYIKKLFSVNFFLFKIHYLAFSISTLDGLVGFLRFFGRGGNKLLVWLDFSICLSSCFPDVQVSNFHGKMIAREFNQT